MLGATASATWTASDGGGSGLVGAASGTITLDTSQPGGATVTKTVADVAGSTATATCTFSVHAAFPGFLQPVDGGSAINVASAGKIIPLKWRLVDASGAPILTWTKPVTVRATTLSCSLGATPDQIEEYAAGSSGLQNLGNGYYQFNWASPKSYANSCKTLHLELGDGADHTANFQFK